jgi:pimeloyl-ACP methyl ester carboxylesterase
MKINATAASILGLVLAAIAGSFAQSTTANESCAGVALGPQPPACFDGTPHTMKCVTVDTGVQLQVLDWGGADKPNTMVLLTGLGDNAHVYDGFAYQFTDYFHVIGITRRGYLPSSQPKEGYDVPTRARDDIAVLKALGISKAVFVGHSVSGSELSELALKHKAYVDKLVYLDALELSDRFQLPDLPPVPYKEGRDERSLQVFQAAQARLENTLEPPTAACFGMKIDAKGALTDNSTPKWVSEKILAGVKAPANPPIDWAKVEAPRLGMFARPSVEARLPFYWYLTSGEQKQFDTNWPGIVQWYADTTRRFQQPHAGKPAPVVYLLPDAPHYFYISDQAFVVRQMREFLLGNLGN